MCRRALFLICAVLLCSSGSTALRSAEPIGVAISRALPSAKEITLRWNPAGSDLAYTVQTRTSLSDGTWLSRSDQRPWPVLENEWTQAIEDAGSVQFYRVLTVPAAERGRLISVSQEGSMTLSEISLLLGFSGIPVTPEFEVVLYKVRYETVDPWGGKTQASGALVLPTGIGDPLPLLSYQHGTLVLDEEAPSALSEQILPGVGFASIGYAVALPDLLGLGESPGRHPYHHARSEATASVDMLRAVRTWCLTNQVTLNGQNFLIGYSQGGHATMSLQRELELYHADEFVVTASAPMAGAYDLSGVTASDLLSGRMPPNPYYLLYLLASYQEVYQLTNNLAGLLASPYDVTLPPLMNGNTDSDAINRAMPGDARLILKPEVLAAIQTQPQYPLLVALRDNDLTQWTPAAPTRLYHCRGDQDVVYANSEVALASFQSRGATQIQLIDPDPAADHGGCAIPAFLLAKTWFETFRQ